jgi:hypothetical protein
MKTIPAVLTFALVTGQSFTDEVKQFIGHFVGGPPKVGRLIVTATPQFGSNPQPGDRVSWLIDVRNPNKTPIYQQLVMQTATNLSPPTPPQVSCQTLGSCLSISQPAAGANPNLTTLTIVQPGAHATITETATILGDGAFSVAIGTGPESVDPVDPATEAPVVATLTGQTGQSTTTTTATSNSTDQGAGAQNSTGGGETESGSVRVTQGIAPAGAYQVGEGVTANFTFWNDGAAPQPVSVLGNDLSGLHLTDYRVCGPRCSFVVPAGTSFLWSVDAVITDGPSGRAPNGFSDTVSYRVGRGDATSTIASGKLGAGSLTWIVLGVAVLATAAAATAIGVNNARRRWWRNHISAHAYARASQATFKPVSIPDHVAVRLEYGPAGPRGPIPIERISHG